MEVLNTLGVNWILLIGYFVNFLIVLFVLNKFVFKPAIANMEKRRQLSQELLTKTDSAQQALNDAKKEFSEIVTRANDQAMQIIGKSEESAKQAAENIKITAQAEAQKIFEKAKKEIAKEKTDLKADLETQLGALVIETVEKVIGQLPSEQKQKVMSSIDTKLGSESR